MSGLFAWESPKIPGFPVNEDGSLPISAFSGVNSLKARSAWLPLFFVCGVLLVGRRSEVVPPVVGFIRILMVNFGGWLVASHDLPNDAMSLKRYSGYPEFEVPIKPG